MSEAQKAHAKEYAVIDSRERFDNALTSLVTECCRVWDHWTLLLGLNESVAVYTPEFHQSPHFWNAVFRVLQDTVIIRLATLLDPRKDVVSVPNILRIIKIHAPGNGSQLGIEIPHFDNNMIEEDLKRVHKLDPTVDKILTLRNDFLAHRSVNIVATHSTDLLPTILNDEITQIIDLVYETTTKYALLYGQNQTLRYMVGSDDYKTLLKALKDGFGLEE